MEISVKNLGVLRQASFRLNDLTILCGENSTGKTYAAYALYGFLNFWWKAEAIAISDENVQHLLDNGNIELDIQEYIDAAPSILKRICEEYTTYLPKVFASPEKHFSKSSFFVNASKNDIHSIMEYSKTEASRSDPTFSMSVEIDSKHVKAFLVAGEKHRNEKLPKFIRSFLSDSIQWVLFGKSFPFPFIASAERTGATVFRKDLNMARDNLLDKVIFEDEDAARLRLLSQGYSDYPSPLKSNIQFTRYLELITDKESFLVREHPEILADFSNIIEGDYLITKRDELYYIPRGKNVKLTMGESSSSVRSLLDIGLYLRHVAARGDILMIDEPELNLHPENQCKMARLFVRLINVGVKVFITTHSDYIIKELNTLIMLNQNDARLKDLAKREGYKSSELLNPEKVSVHIAKKAPVKLNGSTKKSICHTLVPADIDAKLGINAPSFDDTIDTMNRIQEEIIWGE